jgi:hypothetical protein
MRAWRCCCCCNSCSVLRAAAVSAMRPSAAAARADKCLSLTKQPPLPDSVRRCSRRDARPARRRLVGGAAAGPAGRGGARRVSLPPPRCRHATPFPCIPSLLWCRPRPAHAAPRATAGATTTTSCRCPRPRTTPPSSAHTASWLSSTTRCVGDTDVLMCTQRGLGTFAAAATSLALPRRRWRRGAHARTRGVACASRAPHTLGRRCTQLRTPLTRRPWSPPVAAQDKNPGDDAATAQFAEINNGACVLARCGSSSSGEAARCATHARKRRVASLCPNTARHTRVRDATCSL